MTIAEVSRKYNLSADTLRYYERIGLIPTVHRSKSGIRDYTVEDCAWVEFAKCMRGAGIQVEALIEYVSLFQQGEDTTEARKQILIEQRELLLERMEEMRQTLERLNSKMTATSRRSLSPNRNCAASKGGTPLPSFYPLHGEQKRKAPVKVRESFGKVPCSLARRVLYCPLVPWNQNQTAKEVGKHAETQQGPGRRPHRRAGPERRPHGPGRHGQL